MRALLALVILSGVALADEKAVTVHDLEEQGALEIASGKLFQESSVTCRPIPLLRGSGCSSPEAAYGEYKRLKLNQAEFVCISFRGWACLESK
jgi:hypothetical protein